MREHTGAPGDAANSYSIIPGDFLREHDRVLGNSNDARRLGPPIAHDESSTLATLNGATPLSFQTFTPTEENASMKLDVQTDLERWRALMVNRYRSRDASQVSPVVVISYLTYAPAYDDLIELDRFVLVVLYEERRGGYLPVIRCAGCGGAVQAGIAQLGGHGHCRFFKDVALKPQKPAHGARLNLRHPSLTRLALRMESRWQSEMRHLHRPRQSELPFPRLWAAFRTADVERLRLNHSAGRPHHNMQLFPIETVQPHLHEAMTCYVDLAQRPMLQCIQADDVRTGLAGSRGAIAFDFYSSHFRGRRFRDRCRPQVPVTRAERSCRPIHAG